MYPNFKQIHIKMFAGGSCHINDLHHGSTHCLCRDRPDLHWSEVPQCQSSCPCLDEVTTLVIEEFVILTISFWGCWPIKIAINTGMGYHLLNHDSIRTIFSGIQVFMDFGNILLWFQKVWLLIPLNCLLKHFYV